jgi:hypothetical protein
MVGSGHLSNDKYILIENASKPERKMDSRGLLAILAKIELSFRAIRNEKRGKQTTSRTATNRIAATARVFLSRMLQIIKDFPIKRFSKVIDR